MLPRGVTFLCNIQQSNGLYKLKIKTDTWSERVVASDHNLQIVISSFSQIGVNNLSSCNVFLRTISYIGIE